MNLKSKWLKRIVLSIIVVILSSLLILFSYVLGHEKSLMDYQESLAQLPEVERVVEIAEYNGTESYYVAKVLLVNEDEHYYFIKENVVEYNIPVEELITGGEAANRALSFAGSGTVKHYYLGLENKKPIYEVMLSAEKGEQYLMIDAKTGELISHFIID